MHSDKRDSPRLIWLAAATLLLAFNMRSVLVVVAPLVGDIRDEYVISASTAALLTSVPVLCFALLSPLAPRISQRYSTERVLFACAAVIGVGTLIRVVPGLPVLLLGTVVMGSAIAIGNVLLPGLVKRHFPGQVGLMTGLYVVAMNGGATLAAMLAVPLTAVTDSWRGPVALCAVPALLAALLWLPQLRQEQAEKPPSTVWTTLWGDPLAWQVTAFFGLQSVSFFAIATWLPTILVDAGMNPAGAGGQLSIVTLIGIPASLLAPMVAVRLADQRLLSVGVTTLMVVGLFGLSFMPEIATLWSCLIGFGLGAAFSVAMTLIVLRSHDAHQAALLSSMAQTGGYLLATIGPIVFGALYDLSGDWTWSLWLLVGTALLQGILGVLAGRNRCVGQAPAAPHDTEEAGWAAITATEEARRSDTDSGSEDR